MQYSSTQLFGMTKSITNILATPFHHLNSSTMVPGQLTHQSPNSQS